MDIRDGAGKPPMKRSQLSGWDVQLGTALASRMDVATKTAALRGETSLKVANMQIESKRELFEMQMAVTERIAEEDRAVQVLAVELQKEVIGMQKDVIKAQTT